MSNRYYLRSKSKPITLKVEYNKKKKFKDKLQKLKKENDKLIIDISAYKYMLAHRNKEISDKYNNNNNNFDNECSICMMSLFDGRICCLKTCSHIFHIDCIEQWRLAKWNASCPICNNQDLSY